MGTFTQPLYDEASKKGWTVISIKKTTCKTIFIFIRQVTSVEGRSDEGFPSGFGGVSSEGRVSDVIKQCRGVK